MTRKIVITKPGFNALTETDPNNMIYSSEYDTLKYHISGQKTVTAAGADAEETVAHGLGYTPFFIAYNDSIAGSPGTKYNQVPGAVLGIGTYSYCLAYADATNIYFKIITNVFNGSIDFRYKVFRNRLGI